MNKRILSMFLTLLMLVSIIPTNVMAADSGTPSAQALSDVMENTNQGDGVVLRKGVTPHLDSSGNPDGTVDVMIEAYTTGEVRQTTTTVPTDIVLVLDVSGSMDDSETSSTLTSTTYAAVNASRVWRGILVWGEYHYGFSSTSDTYYINLGTAEAPRYVEVKYAGSDENNCDYYYYYGANNQRVYVYPTSSVELSREYNYTVVQFYEEKVSTTTVTAIAALKTAVHAFIESTRQKNAEIAAAGGQELHRIALVKFADDSYYGGTASLTEGNHRMNNGYNYTEVVKNLTVVDEAGDSALSAAVDSLVVGGATAVDYGMNLAQMVLAQPLPTQTQRNKVVIVFSDGEPTYGNSFDSTVANNAISTAYSIKFAGAKVYSISVAPGTDVSNTTSNTNKFFHFMSSNYPNATNMNTSITSGNPAAGYYMTPSSSQSLAMIFESIAQQIEAPTISLGTTAEIVDTMSTYFSIPNGANSLTLQTADRVKNDDGTWDWTDPVTASGLTYTISGKTVEVHGFDYDANYISDTPRTKGSNTAYYGTELIITINAAPDYTMIDTHASAITPTGGLIPSNDNTANLLNSSGQKVAVVDTPYITANTVTYQYTDPTTNQTVPYATYYRLPGATVTQSSAVPTITGYTFSGWSTTDVTVSGGSFTMPQKNVVFTGTFTPNKHNVTYTITGYNPGANVPNGLTDVVYGTNVDIADDLFVAGYTFTGWTSTWPVIGADAESFSMPDHDVELIGCFTANSGIPYQTIHYTQNLDGTFSVKETVPGVGTTGQTVTAAVRTYEGFTLDLSVSGTVSSGTVTADGQFTMHQYHTRNKYTVTYAYEGSTPTGAPNPPVDTEEYYHGQTVTVMPHTAQDAVADHTFAGWHSQNGTVTDAAATFVMPIGGMTLYGKFSTKTDVQFTIEHYLQDANGNYPKEPNETDYESGIAGTTEYAKTYQRGFTGYTYDATVAGSVTEGIVSESPKLVLKLYYKINKYKVTYQYGDTVVPVGATDLATYAQSNVSYNTTVTVKPEATALGYTFSGWSIYSPASTVINTSGTTSTFTMPASNVVLIGHFHANTNTKYRVEYYLQDVEGNDYTLHEGFDRAGTTGATATIEELTYSGFALNEAAAGTKKTGEITADGQLVLKLYYDRLTYKVEYAYDGTAPTGAPALPVDNNTYRYGAEVEIASDLTLVNYEFIGWYSKINGEITPDTEKFNMPIPQNGTHVTLYGYFVNASDVHYTVNHYLEDPQNPGNYYTTPYQTIRPTGTANTVVSNATIQSYQLSNIPGYSYDHFVATPDTQTISQDPGLVIDLYYKLVPYTVTYKIEGSNPGVTIPNEYNTTEYYGTSVQVKDGLKCDGYTFSGWEIKTPMSTVIADGKFTMPAADVTLVGSFIAKTNVLFKVEHYWQNENDDGYTYHETIDYHGGVTGQFIDVTQASYQHLIQNYTGLTFNDKVNGSVLSGTVAGDGSLVLKLYYNRNTYTVTYVYEDTASVKPEDQLPTTNPQTYRYGATVTVAADASAEHHQFIGWYSKADVSVTPDMTSFTMPAADVILYGNFKRIEGLTYKIEHYLMDSSTRRYSTTPVLTETFHDGVAGELVVGTPKESTGDFTGYTYDAAYSMNTSRGTVLVTTDPFYPLTLKLYYALASYNVTYEYEGTLPANRSALPQASTALYQSSVTVADPATAEGYTFSGWHVKTPEGITISNNSFTMPAHDVLLVGSFNIDPAYDVEYWLEQPDGTYQKDEASGHSHTAPADSSVTAYVIHFTGYVENTNHENRVATGTVSATKKLVLKLYYDLIPYTVTYVYEGTAPQNAPALPNVATKYYNYTETTPNPVLSGYTFSGWTSEQVGTVIPGGSFTMPAQNVVLKGQFIAGNADYVIEHYLMNDSGTYEGVTPYTEIKSGVVGDSVRAAAYQPYLALGAEIDGEKIPTHGKWEGIVSATETLTLKLYYSRKPAAQVVYHYEGDLTQAQWQALGWPDLPTDSKQYYVGSTVTALDVIGTKPSSMTFGGWYSSDPTIQVAPNGTFTMPKLQGTDPVVHLYGRWIENAPRTFMVKYFVDNVEQTQYTRTYSLNTPVSVMPKLSDTAGYTYSAWSTPVSVTAGVSPVFNQDGTFTMSAVGEVHIKCTSSLIPAPAETYTVTYYIDGVQYWQKAYEVGQQHIILGAPTMALGHYFSGWSAPRTTSGAIVPLYPLADNRYSFNMPAADVVISATTGLIPIPDGVLKIKKVVEAPDGFTGSNIYAFNVYRLENNVKQLVHTEYVEVNPLTGEGTSGLIKLPKGTNYLVEEVGANVSGYSLETVLTDEYGAVIPAGQTISVATMLNPTEITFTNIYTELPLETNDHFGYIIGYPDGTVRPEGNISRAEVATIFFRLLTDEKRAEYWSQTNHFTDVAPEAWYNNAISTLVNAGALDGYEDGTFRPDNPITRAELVKIAMSFYGSASSGSDIFTDTGEHWASAFINAAAELGFVSGYGDDTFQPDRLVTRAEAMKIINRTLDRSPDKDHLLPDMITWVDNMNRDAWYYAEVQEATNSHTYIDGDLHEIWEEILPIRDWAELEKVWSNAYGGGN